MSSLCSAVDVTWSGCGSIWWRGEQKNSYRESNACKHGWRLPPDKNINILPVKKTTTLPQSRVEGVGSGTPGCRPIMALQSSPVLTTHPDSLASVLLWPPLHRLEELRTAKRNVNAVEMPTMISVSSLHTMFSPLPLLGSYFKEHCATSSFSVSQDSNHLTSIYTKSGLLLYWKHASKQEVLKE